MTIDNEQVIAFVDGELGEGERVRMAAAADADPALAARIDAHRRLQRRLQAAFAEVAAEPVPAPLMLASRATVIPFPLRPRTIWRALPQAAALAAAIALGVLVGPALSGPSDIVVSGRGLVAGGSFAQALETQATDAGTVRGVRIGLTFPAGASWCRSFRNGALAGIACRSRGGWELRRTFAGGAADVDYRQAAADPSGAAAQAMATGRPLDAASEHRLIAQHWSHPTKD